MKAPWREQYRVTHPPYTVREGWVLKRLLRWLTKPLKKLSRRKLSRQAKSQLLYLAKTLTCKNSRLLGKAVMQSCPVYTLVIKITLPRQYGLRLLVRTSSVERMFTSLSLQNEPLSRLTNTNKHSFPIGWLTESSKKKMP